MYLNNLILDSAHSDRIAKITEKLTNIHVLKILKFRLVLRMRDFIDLMLLNKDFKL
jgi:hypothetical protein